MNEHNIGRASSAATIAINFILKTINIKIVDTVGFSRKSKVTSVVMLVIMVSTFINTAFLRLVVNGRFGNAPFPFNYIGVQQEFPDFTHEWYMFNP